MVGRRRFGNKVGRKGKPRSVALRTIARDALVTHRIRAVVRRIQMAQGARLGRRQMIGRLGDHTIECRGVMADAAVTGERMVRILFGRGPRHYCAAEETQSAFVTSGARHALHRSMVHGSTGESREVGFGMATVAAIARNWNVRG